MITGYAFNHYYGNPPNLDELRIRFDYANENGIIQHLIFEGEEIEEALKELNEIRKEYFIKHS